MAASNRALVVAREARLGQTVLGLAVLGLAMLGSLGGPAGSARADTLLIEGVDAAAPTASERPKRGTSMASVEARFGPPATRTAAVGQPPITRWDYSTFTVYFEYDHVLHSVHH